MVKGRARERPLAEKPGRTVARDANEWGIPNWRDASAYPPDWVSPRVYAWEFLRRNAEYRAAWLERRAILKVAGFSDDWVPGREESPPRTASTPAALWSLDPPALAGETIGEYEDRIGEGVEYTMRWAGYALTREWGYSYGDLIDPRRPSVTRINMNGRECFGLSGDLIHAFGIGACPSVFAQNDSLPQLKIGEAAVVFDLAAPLRDQLDRARRLLQDEQKRFERTGSLVVTKPPKDKPSSAYLRIIDAVDSGAKQREIARLLYPTIEISSATGRVAKQLKTAEALRDDGWRRLMLLSE